MTRSWEFLTFCGTIIDVGLQLYIGLTIQLEEQALLWGGRRDSD